MTADTPSLDEAIEALRVEIMIVEAKPTVMVARQHVAALRAALAQLEASRWRPINTFKDDGRLHQVDVWMQVHASPRSFGMADAFRVTEAWREAGTWFHMHNGKPAELYGDYITHWKPLPAPPATAREGEAP